MKKKQPIVSFENIGLRYGDNPEILKNINLTINKGDFLFLVGDSGAGKTSLLNLINLSLKPSRGFLNIFNHDIASIKPKNVALLRRRMGVIFQDFQLINHLSIFDNIALPLQIDQVPPKEIKEKVTEILEWINLKQFENSLPLTLSGGQQQRVAIARAIIKNPDIILADEPTGSIDFKMSERILRMLEQLNKQGVAIVFATHNLELLTQKNYPVAHLTNNQLEIIRS
ncbi:Cell division ATP-binding protein FtsE [Candidatus Hepatincola sp. Pdp]